MVAVLLNVMVSEPDKVPPLFVQAPSTSKHSFAVKAELFANVKVPATTTAPAPDARVHEPFNCTLLKVRLALGEMVLPAPVKTAVPFAAQLSAAPAVKFPA